jgi:hypothetical protein
MPRGTSGRIVIEVNPELKDELYSVLQEQELTLKDWFISNAQDYLNTNHSQLDLALPEGGK